MALARFSVSASYGTLLREVDFDATASISPWSLISQYDWDFGDGHIASGVTSSHVYSAEGIYPVTLTITTPEGQFALTELTMIGIPPVIESISSSASQLAIQDRINLECLATHARGDTLTYDWKVISGPGVLYQESLESDSSSVAIGFSRPGAYEIAVVVSNGLIEVSHAVQVNVLPDLRDFDNDGMTNSDEDYNHNGIIDDGESAEIHPDWDGDGLWDHDERRWGVDPLVADLVFRMSRDGTGARVWSAHFEEDGEGYVVGALDGAFAWHDDSNLSLVGLNSGVGGSQGVTLPSHSGGSRLYAYWGLQRSQTVSIQFDGQLTPGTLPSVESLEPAASLFMVNTDGFVCGYNGNTQEWVQSAAMVTPESWHTYTVDLNYMTKTWSLHVDGVNRLTDLGFLDSTLERFSRISFEQLADDDGSAFVLDNLFVVTDSPLDAWFAFYFDDLTAEDSQPSSDADRDGASNLLEYSQGGNPLVNDYAQWAPVLSMESGNMQFRFRQDGEELDYIVESRIHLAEGEWVPDFDEVTISSDGTFSFAAPSLAEYPTRFYRLRVIDYAE